MRALRGKYAIVGIGETAYSKQFQGSVRQMGVHAVARAADDAGIAVRSIDGIVTHAMGDSVSAAQLAADLSMEPAFSLDVIGGGASVEALVGVAIGAIEAGMCRRVALFRSMRGYSGSRTGARKEFAPTREIHSRAPFASVPAAMFAPVFLRHMVQYGTRPEQVAMIRVVQGDHAARNPKALYRKPVTVEEVLASRFIAEPIHALECCIQSDSATCIVISSTEEARDCRHVPVRILAAVGRVGKAPGGFHGEDITVSAGRRAAELLWRNAGLGPQEVDITAAYDAFAFTSLLLLEDYGFCTKGEGGDYVSDGTIRLGGSRPNNTSGGLLAEGYSHGMNLVIENVRQLRGDADDDCPAEADGRRAHTHDYSAGGRCRQVRDAEVAANLGWATPELGSAVVLCRG